jgi:uncharacterized membrane-anchored protein
MRKFIVRAALAALALTIAAPAYSDGPGDAGPDVAAPPVNVRPQPAPTEPVRAAPIAPPQGRSGVVPLSGGALTINVPRNYRFYGPEEANAFLQRNGAAAPAGEVLGLVAPANADVRAPGTWATVVSYDAIGYVQAETASGLSDTAFEDQVREARRAQNRPFEGFAAPPAYTATATPRLVWAERAAAPGSATAADLRYEQKSLGRYGVACLTSIGAADQMPAMQAAAETLQGMMSFPEGRRHEDFLPASDSVSDYTVPALVTGVNPQAQAIAEPAADASAPGQTSFGGLAGWFPWIALGVVVLAGVGYFLMRPRHDDDDDSPEEPTSPERDQTAA